MLYSYTTELHLSIVGETLLHEYIYSYIYTVYIRSDLEYCEQTDNLVTANRIPIIQEVRRWFSKPKFLQKNFGLAEKKI